MLVFVHLMPGLPVASAQDTAQPPLGAEPAAAPVAAGLPIAAVEYVGVDPARKAYIDGVVRLKAGDAFSQQAVDEAVSRLLRTGRFWSASAEVESRPEGPAVVFRLRERPVVKEVRFDGNSDMTDAKLRPLVPIKPGDLVDRFSVSEGADAIAAKYKSAGYSDVRVTFDETLLDSSGELVYRIEEGTRKRIREIVFRGATAYDHDHLMKQIDTRTAWWFFRVGELDREKVESDTAALERYYRDEGWLDAKVTYRAEAAGEERLTLIFDIVEGTRYTIERIALTGRTVFPEQELIDLTTLRDGAYIRRFLLEKDAQAIQALYGEYGYIYATVRATWVFSATPDLVRVTHEIVEGGQFKVGRVEVRGNTRTKDKVVRRALDMYPPDDLWNMTAAREAEKELRDTRVFDQARVMPVGDDPGVRDVIMDVKEADKTGDFLFGFGVTSNNGLVGKFSLDLHNFDLYDVPRTWGDFLRMRSFFGAGQKLRLELEPGTQVNRYRIDFTEPYFLDRPISLTTSLYLFERGRDGYHESRIGATAALGKRFERGILHGWAGEIAARIEGVDITPESELGTTALLAHDIRDVRGSSLLTSLRASIVRDRTDNRFIPSDGDRLRFSYEQVGMLGGDYLFGKAGSSYTWYRTMATDHLDRKSVLSLHGEVGSIVGDAPLFERHYLGGIGTVRGFAFRGASPRDGLEDNLIGGDLMLLGGAEYTYPLVGEWLRGLVFVDTGWLDGFRASTGAGVRLTINFLGPVPLEFHVAAPLVKEDDDDVEVFSFVVGGTFFR